MRTLLYNKAVIVKPAERPGTPDWEPDFLPLIGARRQSAVLAAFARFA
jgi:hypothetical protein